LLGLRELADDAAKDTDPPMTLGNMRANARRVVSRSRLRSPSGARRERLSNITRSV